MGILIAPSILSADFANLKGALVQIEDSKADWVHLDVMDGQFVPNITFGPKLTGDIKRQSGMFFDVHLMVQTPERVIRAFAAAGADAVTFHLEAAGGCGTAGPSLGLLQEIRGMGAKAGISIVPSTPAGALTEILPYADLVLVMTVNPGFGGQKLIPECLEKVRYLAEERKKRGLNFLISVDGGINEKTAAMAVSSGADVLVTGSAFFNAQDKKAFVLRIKGNRK